MKNLKKLNRDDLKKLNGGDRILPCHDIRDVSSCYDSPYQCQLYSHNCNIIEYCGQTLYCVF